MLVFLLADLGLTEHPAFVRATQTNRAAVITIRDFMGAFTSSGHGEIIQGGCPYFPNNLSALSAQFLRVFFLIPEFSKT